MAMIENAFKDGIRKDDHFINWGANNICKGISQYPNYGDNVNTWCPVQMNGNEYLDIEYEHPVFITEVHVYETLQPGSTCKISVMEYHEDDSHGDWIVLWEDQSVVTSAGSASRDFSPPIQSSVFTKRIRVDLKITNAWSEIDTVCS